MQGGAGAEVVQFVAGVEATCGVLEQSDGTLMSLPPIENVPGEGTFDYELRHKELAAGSGVLRDKIHALGLQVGVATPRELLHTLAPSMFGQYRTSDYNKAIRQLVTIGCIDRRTPTGIKETEELRFLELEQASLGIS